MFRSIYSRVIQFWPDLSIISYCMNGNNIVVLLFDVCRIFVTLFSKFCGKEYRYYKVLDLVSSGSKDNLKIPQGFIVLMHI